MRLLARATRGIAREWNRWTYAQDPSSSAQCCIAASTLDSGSPHTASRRAPPRSLPFGRTLAYVWLGASCSTRCWCVRGTRSSRLTRRTFGTWTGSEPPSARPVRQREALGPVRPAERVRSGLPRCVHPNTAARPELFGHRRAQVHGVIARPAQLRRRSQQHRMRRAVTYLRMAPRR